MSRWAARLVLVVLLILTVMGCRKQNAEPEAQDLVRIQSETAGKHSKKIILLVVDSLMPKQIDEGVRRRELPAFRYLIEHGQYYKNMVSSFPTMSVSIDSALITGTYPNEHRVPGLIWYSWKDGEVVNYGTGPMEVARQGVRSTLINGIMRLNGSHLNPKLATLYEDLARRGQTTGSINGLLYRGLTSHRLDIPGWLRGTASLPKEVEVKGPDFLALGTLANPLEGIASLPDEISDRFGLSNAYSISALNYLIENGKLPDFLLVYLPDLDQKIHKKGTNDLDGIKKVDEQLDSVLTRLGSRNKGSDEVVLMIIGDSGMTDLLPADRNSVVRLPELLKDYRILKPGEEVTEETDIVLAVNETMAYLYKLNPNEKLESIAHKLTADSRVDFVAWKEGEWIRVLRDQTNRELAYKPGGEMRDRYEQKWTTQGELSVLDLATDEKGRKLEYGRYPDALMRLCGALNSHEGDFLILTAKPGYELADRSSPTHEGGGGHGSLGRQESLVPLILYGTDRKPRYLRIVDLKPFIVSLLTDGK
ncbi:alkaline phosphatase family protein [Cohnella thailandensis]|uniref:Alkaline phosphatase family protein n=1 Tax=Cohnella thailandensis TaxID=557557 RepID=A0A841T1R0_9BACL|nr:alkaline phosphatase family protein [Cohnella thailandensis]MBB6636505.1 alkaline phosphatase family protein [Cohnella thailandensis]MBP1977623.1 putative AlkP superfamily pyrophosphatase or phosphodiesterase [Cohnella thailandensis]